MSGYSYEAERLQLFTDQGQRMLLGIRDRANKLLTDAGAATMGRIIAEASGDSWQMLACVDRMVELGELREVEQGYVMAQDRIFVKANR